MGTQQNKPVKETFASKKRMMADWILQGYSDLVPISDRASQFRSQRIPFPNNPSSLNCLAWKKNNRVFRDQWELAQRLMDELHDEAVLWMTGSQLSMGAGNDPVFHFSDLLFRQINCITAPIFTIHSRRRTSWSNALYLLPQFQTKATP